MNLVYLFKALLKQKYIIALVAITAFSVTFFLTKDLKKQYKSYAEFSTGFTISDQVRLQDDKLNLTESDVKFNNVIETLISPKVVSFVSYNLIVHDLSSPTPFRKSLPGKISPIGYLKIQPSIAKEMFLKKLSAMQILTSYKPEEKRLIELLKFYGYDYESLLKYNLAVNRIPGTDYISIVASTENPDLSSFLVNDLCNQFLNYNKSQNVERSEESVVAFKTLMEQKQRILLVKIDSLKRYKSAHGVLNIESEGKSNYELIKTYETQLASERNNYNGINIELKDVDKKLAQLGSNQGPKVNVINAEVLSLRNQLSSLRAELERKGDADPALKAKINEIQNALIDKQDKMNSNLPIANEEVSQRDLLLERQSDLKIKLETSSKNIFDYENGIRRLKLNYSLDASTEANINSLQKEIDLANQEYTSAKEKYSQATDLGRASFNGNIKQVLFGQPAISPEPSKRLIIVALSVITAVIFCVLLIILLEYLDGTLKTPFIFSAVVNLNLMAVVNRAKLKKVTVQSLFDGAKINKKENQAFKESLRKCRFEIEHLNMKTLLFTSTKSGEGKSLLMMAVASAFSSTQKKVLLIDTNFSNNTLSIIFQAKPILEKLGRGDKEMNREEMAEYITKTENPFIDVLGCIGGSYSPSEILNREAFKNLITRLSWAYDFIFFEGASLNQFSDSKELAEFVEGVIAVFSGRSGIKQVDRESISFLNSLNSKFVGAILNKVELDQIDQ